MSVAPPQVCDDCVDNVRQAVTVDKNYARWFALEYNAGRFNYCQDCGLRFTFGEQLELGDIAKAVSA